MARRSSNFAKHHFYIDALYTSTSQTIRGEGPVVAFCFVLPVSNLSQTSTFVKHNKDELVGKKKKKMYSSFWHCFLVSALSPQSLLVTALSASAYQLHVRHWSRFWE